MADITMCVSKECPVKDTCYRYKAKVNPIMQSYADFSYTCNVDSGFDDYIKFDNKSKND